MSNLVDAKSASTIPLLEFDHVSFAYDERLPILKDVSFRVNAGDFVAFLGTNGAGKSTAMRLINGLLHPDTGEVRVEGVSTAQLKTSALARRIGFLFQNPDSQICCNTVAEELSFGFKVLGFSEQNTVRRVQEVVDEFGFAGDADPFLLNRGTRQLLALASVVALKADILVLDEPTTGLDYRECCKVMDTVSELHKHGSTIIMVCHDMEVVADYADAVIVMHEGRVLRAGPTFDVLRNRELMEAASLLPPQIPDISLRLSALGKETEYSSEGMSLAQANTVDEMFEAVVSAVCKRDNKNCCHARDKEASYA